MLLLIANQANKCKHEYALGLNHLSPYIKDCRVIENNHNRVRVTLTVRGTRYLVIKLPHTISVESLDNYGNIIDRLFMPVM